MAKWSAEPRFPLNGEGVNPTIEYNKDEGLQLSGWFITPEDVFNPPPNPPTEREMVAGIFRYILDQYTDREDVVQGEDFKNVGNQDYEIPVNVIMGFARN